MIPSEFSEHKERDVVLVLHHHHVSVMNARSCAKRRKAQFFRFSGASFLHVTYSTHNVRALELGDLSAESAMPVAHAGCIPCDLGIRREPSRIVCHFFTLYGKAYPIRCSRE